MSCNLNSLPKLDFTSSSLNISSLKGFDVNMNLTSNVDFNYYSIDNFNDSQNIQQIIAEPENFCVLNSNIRSLSANIDNLTKMLSDLSCKFNIIGLSETKIRLGNSTVT